MHKIGQTLNIGYYGGFRNQRLIKTQAEITNVSDHWIEIKVRLSCGGYRTMFGYDHQLKKLEDNFTK